MPEDVHRQFGRIAERNPQVVLPVVFEPALLFRMPGFLADPAGAGRAEHQLGPFVLLPGEDPLTGVEYRLQFLFGHLPGGLGP